MKSIALFSLILTTLISAQSFALNEKGRHFDRVITVIFENTNYEFAIKQPFFNHLAQTGAHFTNLFAITHPSQPNYIALTSGSLNGVVNNAISDLDVQNITNLLEAKNFSWKVYIEDYPGNCFTGAANGLYERRHNPFISYTNISKNSVRCTNLVHASEFDQDAKNGTLPNYSFYIPNNKNSGHDTGVAYADEWYGKKFLAYTEDENFMKNTLLISTFDESGSLASNQIYVSMVGGAVKPGEYSESLTAYSVLQLIELNWDLGDLGKEDKTAPTIPAIWK